MTPTTRAAIAEEFSKLLLDLQRLLHRGERLADASGGLVEAKYFRGAKAMMVMAAGDLESKGMLLQPAPEHPLGESKEIVG